MGHSDRKQPNERVESEFFVDSDSTGPSKPGGVRIAGPFGQKAIQMSALSPNSVLIRTQLVRVSREESEFGVDSDTTGPSKQAGVRIGAAAFLFITKRATVKQRLSSIFTLEYNHSHNQSVHR
ncbi:hypothetical protein [Bacillus sp. AK031]